jgi:hypothetical protein
MEDLGTGPALPRQIFVHYRKQLKGRLLLLKAFGVSWNGIPVTIESRESKNNSTGRKILSCG